MQPVGFPGSTRIELFSIKLFYGLKWAEVFDTAVDNLPVTADQKSSEKCLPKS